MPCYGPSTRRCPQEVRAIAERTIFLHVVRRERRTRIIDPQGFRRNRRSSSWTWANWKRFYAASRPSNLAADDYQTIRELIESYVGLTLAVGDKSTTIRRLRQMLFAAKTEKAAAVVGARLARDENEAVLRHRLGSRLPRHPSRKAMQRPLEPIVGADVQSTPKCRPQAMAAMGPTTTRAQRRSTCRTRWPGDPCPQCETARSTRRADRAWWCGRSPHLRLPPRSIICKARCNLCGVVFTATLPEGTGEGKYDASVGSMIALLKYGTGMPFHRRRRHCKRAWIPLAASTQWDIVAAQAERVEPVFAELVQQAAQGDVVYNDDTTIKILAVMGERARQTTLSKESVGAAVEDSGETLAEDLADLADQPRVAGRHACIAKSTAEPHGHVYPEEARGKGDDRVVPERTPACRREPEGRASPACGRSAPRRFRCATP